MSGIKLNIGAGYISAFYFVILDIFLLTQLDIVFSRVVCYLYYHRINAGFPVSVQSADIPGVTTNLIGRYYSRANIIVYLLKFFCLGCLLYIDLGITNVEITTTAMITRTGIFVFNASDSVWVEQSGTFRKEWELFWPCYIQKGEIAQFYDIAFDFSHGLVLDNELAGYDTSQVYQLNDTTLECLSPDYVTEKYTSPGISVIGCSQLEPTNCLNETIISKSADLRSDVTLQDGRANVAKGNVTYPYKVVHYDYNAIFIIFPVYATNATISHESEMTCTTTFIGLYSKGLNREFTNCILVVYNESTTIIEQWEYNASDKKLVRYLPGPVFSGTVEFGRLQRINQLSQIRPTGVRWNWLSFSASIAARSMVYQYRNQTFERYKTRTEGTELSRRTITLAAILLILVIVARLVVTFTVGQDSRPQLNTIDGLSSIGREEFQPSGQSLVSGDNLLLGWSCKGSTLARFGPVRSADHCVKQSSLKEVE